MGERPYRILVTGSRDFTDQALACKALADAAAGVPRDTVVLVTGCARGADRIAELYAGAQDWGIERHRVTPEDWERDGWQAGHLRNARMVAAGADVCVALIMPCSKPGCRRPQPHDSHGTADCMAKAKAAAIPVQEIRP